MIDQWIGKTLFVPPIIKLCQLTRQSQFAVSRLFWFIAALDGFYRAETLFGSILWGWSERGHDGHGCLACRPTHGQLHVLPPACGRVARGGPAEGRCPGGWAGVEFWLFVLSAEYAAVIRTIPPREAHKATSKMPAAE